MNKNFAIKGHISRGVEVIKILEMLGGKTSYECSYKDGFDTLYYFFINTDENFFIDGHSYKSEELKNYDIFTLEEFIEKFPYKVGDKVFARGSAGEITDMKWQSDSFFTTKEEGEVVYTVMLDTEEEITFSVEDLRPYKEETFGECIEKTINECLFGSDEETMKERENSVVVNIEHKQLKVNSLRFDKTQLVLNDEYELKQERDAYYIVRKKLQYPKTYKESCDILGIDTMYNDARGYKDFLIVQFQELIISRDAYWKIIGKQMGLDEPWKPDWTDSNFKYCLKKMGDNIEKSSEMTISCILAFPTEEIRNIFYNNFKNTIEQCKELL